MLRCSKNQISTLNLINCSQLTKIWCHQNQLTQLIFPPKLPSLEELNCSDNFLTKLDWNALSGEKLMVLSLANNNFDSRDLSYLVEFTNLKRLYLQSTDQSKISKGIYNRWAGSLQFLQNMKKLRTLRVDNTNLDNGTEYLPDSIMGIVCSHSVRSDSKVKLIDKELEQNTGFLLVSFLNKIYLKKKLPLEIIKQIKDFNYEKLTPEQEKLFKELIPNEYWRENYKRNGLCANCQQLNGEGEWCQSCTVPYLQANFTNWTSGQEEIDKLIKKCQLEAKHWRNMLEWIPYEQFANIEYLATGGFSKVYKVKWIDGLIKGWNTKNNKLERWGVKDVVLKILTNSQNMTVELLQETINHKLTASDGYSSIVECLGISQEPGTGNYVMVMEYVEGGNLRQFLQCNYNRLDFQTRLNQLLQITQGLQSIHQASLVHRDFHTGNVLSWVRNDNEVGSFITDLGLSRPAQEANKDKVYGVLPYVAPEVLQGKHYIQASDIYSLSMIIYELFSNQPPFAEYAYDICLAERICEGLRPNLEEVIAPQLLKDLISRCWDASPAQRPTAGEVISILLHELDWDYSIRKNTEFYYQHQELLATKALDSLTNKPPQNYPTEKYTSRLLDYENPPQPQNSQEPNEQFYGGSRSLELTLDMNELTIQNYSQEESSIQAQIQLPPKNNLN